MSIGFPRTQNDKQIVKGDEFPSDLHTSNHCLSTRFWFCDKGDGSVVKFRGLYVIVDGEYLRWPSLICVTPHNVNPHIKALSTKIMLVRKDIEDVFGILKKRFKCLKSWTVF